VDLIRAPRGKSQTASEGKWSARDFNPANLLTLRPRLSQGNLAGAPPTPGLPSPEHSGAEVQFGALDRLVARIAGIEPKGSRFLTITKMDILGHSR